MSAGAGRPRAVLFDAMGTLVRLQAPAPALQRLLREVHGVDVSAEDAERAAREEMFFYRNHHDEGFDVESLSQLRLRCAEVMLRALPAAGASITADALVTTLMEALRFETFPDALPALRALRGAGLRLAVVSNWDASLPEVLDRVGLAGFFDVLVASAVVRVAKPGAGIFEIALRDLGVAAEDALHVGDTIEHDVAGALAAGIAPVLVRRDRSPVDGLPDGVPVVASLEEVPALLDRVARPLS